jgi:hypothetical protein
MLHIWIALSEIYLNFMRAFYSRALRVQVRPGHATKWRHDVDEQREPGGHEPQQLQSELLGHVEVQPRFGQLEDYRQQGRRVPLLPS